MNPIGVILLSLAAAAPIPAITTIEKDVLDYRRAIESGQVILRAKTFHDGHQTPDREVTTTVWFSGQRIRCDAMLRYQPDKPFHRDIWCRNCERDNHSVYYSEQEMPAGTVLALDLRPITASETSNNLGAMLAFDPRMLGLIPCSSPNLAQFHYESYIRRADRDPPTVRVDTLNDTECWRIDYAAPKTETVTVWIHPEKGPGVVRIDSEFDGRTKDEHFQDRVECEYSRFGSSGTWLPSKTVYEHTLNGAPLQREVVEVEVVSLNKPVDPTVFTLAGMNIRPTTPITGYDDPRGSVHWDGKEIAPYRVAATAGLDSLPDLDSNPGMRRLLLIGNAVFFLAIGAYALRRYFARKRDEVPKKP